MKFILISDNDEPLDLYSRYLEPLGYDLIHYRDPLKAMDNLDEIAPELIIFNAEDFPRHWKPFIKVLRSGYSKTRTIFLLLYGDHFSFDEAAKASHLEVNGLLPEIVEKAHDKLKDILKRYSTAEVEEKREHQRLRLKDDADLQFIFNHPDHFSMITGTVADISIKGLRFLPDTPALISDLTDKAVIPSCSLSMGETIFTLDARIEYNQDGALGLSFTEPEPAIERYLKEPDPVPKEFNTVP